jgi:hypothetical protein
MITLLPAVQDNIHRVCRWFRYNPDRRRWDKRHANRRARRLLNRLTRGFVRNPELFYSEDFWTPSLSARDIW